ncbi:MAG: ABC transporter ATP-binding protein [Cyclobacteriaceae bacterium]|nr:ABC transporter ATP-binding protein [Cyclobacteriaceae bacterium HetDA_MAG_MS6]
MASILEVDSLRKTYTNGSENLTVLDGVAFTVPAGGTCAIVGPSGSGKTTLLGLCAGLDHVSEGSITLNHILLNKLSEDQLAQIRNEFVGFIFQNFQLIPTLTALENVMVPLELRGIKGAKATSEELLARVGLGERINHYPTQLSGGEQQRVAIARAFSNNPQILFADEPTGNLDEETSQSIETLLFEINREKGTTLVIVTHDNDLAKRTDQIIRLKGGRIVENVKAGLQTA